MKRVLIGSRVVHEKDDTQPSQVSGLVLINV